jgi:hypothetical protein
MHWGSQRGRSDNRTSADVKRVLGLNELGCGVDDQVEMRRLRRRETLERARAELRLEQVVLRFLCHLS